MRHRSAFALLCAIVMALCLPIFSASGSKAELGKVPYTDRVQASDLSVSSINGSPLQINVYADGSIGLLENGVNQFYNERASGVFLWAGGDVWGPFLGQNFTLIDQSQVFGAGNAADPYRVTTVFQAGSTGLTLTQVVTYVNGARDISFGWKLQNNGPAQSVSLFHAADLYVNGNDYGTGFFDNTNRTIGGFNLESRVYGLFTPITPASAYEEARYSTIWSRISNGGARGSGFLNRSVDQYIDNGAGLQWNVPTLANGASYQIQDRFSITPVPVSGNTALELPPVLEKTEFLPPLHEFEYGTQVSSSNTAYSGNAISFNLPISRFYGSQSNIAPTAYLTLRAFDVDSPSEVDVVKVNGCATQRRLTGRHNSWQEVTLAFPSSCLRFPTPIDYTDSQYDKNPIPTPAQLQPRDNQIAIDVDTLHRGYKTMVAWAKLYVGGVRPVLFAHGLDPECQNGEDRGLGQWKSFLQNDGIPGLGNRSDGSKSIFTQYQSMKATYAEMQRLFGLRRAGQPGIGETDKIIVVGHSMGGLTGRYFIDILGSDTVDHFVTFGTPNRGALLARYGLGKAACSSEARDDLKVPYVRDIFNPVIDLTDIWEPASASSHMSSIAARLQPAASGDGVVSTDSTRALPYDSDVTYNFDSDSYSDETTGLFVVLHTLIPDLRSMYARVKSEGQIGKLIDQSPAALLAAIRAAPLQASAAIAPASPADPVAIISAAPTLAPGASTTVSFPVDQVARLSIMVNADSTTGLSYTLQSPSGVVYGSISADWELDNPEIGTWIATLSLAAGAPQPAKLAFAATVISNISIDQSAVPFYVPVGQAGAFEVTLQDNGAPLLGLNVSGILSQPDGSTTAVAFTQSGTPGNYRFDYTPAASGRYGMDISVSGTRLDGSAFQREGTLFATAITGGMLGPVVGWQSPDLDNDGLTDTLDASVQISVPAAGAYTVVAGLGTAARPAQIGAETTIDLAAGTQTVTLSFPGEAIGRLPTADVYWVQQVKLIDRDANILDWRPQLDSGYYIDPAGFQQRLLTGQVVSASPIDSNGDGRFDTLTFNAVLTAKRSGNYMLQATLGDDTGQPFDFAEQGLFLDVGENSVAVPFAGDAIAANGVSGVFTLSDLVVVPLDAGSGDQTLRLINSFQTGRLSISDFAEQVQLTVDTNLASTAGYVQITPASANNRYSQGTSVELRPIFSGDPSNTYTWSVDSGPETTSASLTLVMDTNHSVRLTVTSSAPPESLSLKQFLSMIRR